MFITCIFIYLFFRRLFALDVMFLSWALICLRTVNALVKLHLSACQTETLLVANAMSTKIYMYLSLPFPVRGNPEESAYATVA